MRFFIGLSLVLVGLYFLGKNVVFATHYLPFWWQDISATAAVLCITGGILALILADENLKKAGLIFIFLGVVLVFVNARVFIKPTSLWSFIWGIGSMVAGFRIMHGLRG